MALELGVNRGNLVSLNQSQYLNFTEVFNNYTDIEIYPYSVVGLSELEFYGDFDYETFLSNARTKNLRFRVMKKLPKLKLNTYGFAEMDLDLKSIQLMGSDTSFLPQKTSYSSLVMIKSQERIATEAFRRCKLYEECSNQMLSYETLAFAYKQLAISLDIPDKEKEEMMMQQESFLKARPN